MIKVLLTDRGHPWATIYNHYDEAAGWALEHCPSFVGYDPIDVSDVSLEHDVLCEYTFNDARDATAFKLRWS